MDAAWRITVFVIIDEVRERVDHRSHVLAEVPDAEILTLAGVAAQYVHHHHQRAVCIRRDLGYLAGPISVARVNRRVHALAEWLTVLPTTLGAVFSQGEVCVIDSLPIPVCRRAGAPLSQGPWAHRWWLLCRQKRTVLRLAAGSGVYTGGRAGAFHHAASGLA